MKIAINKKSSRTKLSTSNPQQPINSKNTEKTETAEKSIQRRRK